MAWSWRYEKDDGTVIPPNGLPGVHDQPEYQSTQSDAESWLGENWRTLAAAGVAQVHLLDDDRPIYGPLKLELAE
ncbi:hypothetical protein [Actinocorallia sp. A-T 12471]|uniref:hypothetical protein n=1 Tax=Actinocorallia sp. A-T 12471 TaxID=3089813 RepID=UPI0029D24346|nr:hypothetical protein [Actinocorallia sp. A-T 12471]MDX6743219.1 hypothetical protein [Actinocorallia sp. A-T 12471]